MAYTELTCDDAGLTSQDLYRMSLVDMGDGTFAQRVVEVTVEPVIAFTLSSGSVNGDYVFSQVGNTPLGPTALIWTQVGGDPDTDFVAVAGGFAFVWSGGVERYLSISPGADPEWPPDYTDWILGAGGTNPTPTFS